MIPEEKSMLRANTRISMLRNFLRRGNKPSHLCIFSQNVQCGGGTATVSENTSFEIGYRRTFSDNLLGYSPMAKGSPNQPSSTPGDGKGSGIPTAQDVSTSGGVWAPTSAKRDKLAELKIELTENQETLDDAATPQQLQDLYLADGLKLITKTVDSSPDTDTQEIQELSEWLVELQKGRPESIDQAEFESVLTIISEKLAAMESEIPPSRYLMEVRDFFDLEDAPEEDLSRLKESDLNLQNDSFERAVLRFRLLLTQAAVDHLKESWAVLTTVSDGDVDRAAVKGESIPSQLPTIPLAKVLKFLFSNVSGTCADRVDACWDLLDHDGDGLLDEAEMNNAALFCLTPVQTGLVQLFEEALEAYPVLAPMPEIGDQNIPVPKGWRARRKEAKAKKKLLKMFKNSSKNHFQDEVEIHHRLRCIYAWAEKVHQNNRLDSITVDDGWSSKKRYVELAPKISLPEFREVQQEHFTHLDRMGTEILKSFREDLWVSQGKGRQNRELMRDSIAFLAVVSVLDYLILAS